MDISDDFTKLKRPKEALKNDVILISDPPIGWRIFLTFFCLFLTAIFLFENSDDNFLGIVVCSLFSFVFLYDSLSLNRVKVDLRKKIIIRKTLNPVANLLDRMLQHPSVIPFDKITRFAVTYPSIGGPDVQRYYLFAEYDGLYKLNIGIFKTGDDAERVADFLRYKIKAAHGSGPK